MTADNSLPQSVDDASAASQKLEQGAQALEGVSAPQNDKASEGASAPENAQAPRRSCGRLLLNVVFGVLLGLAISLGIIFLTPLRHYGMVVLNHYLGQPEVAPKSVINIPKDATDIYLCYEYLSREFFRDIPKRDLLNGAIVGANGFVMMKNNLDAPPMALLEEDLTDEALFPRYSERFEKLIQDYPKLREDIIMSSLAGLTLATYDPYTIALSKEATDELKEQLGAENYCGVGTYIESDHNNNKQLTIIEPIDGGPAAKAGLLPGDCIMKIDDKPTKDMDLETCAKKMRGPAGTTVKLRIKRGAQPEYDLSLVRAELTVKSVTYKKLSDGTGYIRLRFFGSDTGKDCHVAMQDLVSQHCERIILDLRNNGGGAVDEAIIVASQFLPKDKTVTSVVAPRSAETESYASQGNSFPELPMAVLVNQFSASASEIVAGALKDHGRAILVGEKTFGKGSVQMLRLLNGGRSIKYTIAHYLTPSSKDIHLKGIEPQIKYPAPFSNRLGDSKDKQLQEAQRVLIKGIDAATKQPDAPSVPSTLPLVTD